MVNFRKQPLAAPKARTPEHSGVHDYSCTTDLQRSTDKSH